MKPSPRIPAENYPPVELDDLAAIYLQSRAVHRKVTVVCSVAGVAGVGILGYVLLAGTASRGIIGL